MQNHRMNVLFETKTTTDRLKCEAIDRLNSVVADLPKYKNDFTDLMCNFTIDKTLKMLYTIDRDREFKSSKYYHLYSIYFDEIEDMIFKVDL